MDKSSIEVKKTLYDITKDIFDAKNDEEARSILFGSDLLSTINREDYYNSIIAKFVRKKEILIQKKSIGSTTDDYQICFNLENDNEVWDIIFIGEYIRKFCDYKVNEIDELINARRKYIQNYRPNRSDIIFLKSKDLDENAVINVDYLNERGVNYDLYRGKTINDLENEFNNISELRKNDEEIKRLNKLKEYYDIFKTSGDISKIAAKVILYPEEIEKNINVDDLEKLKKSIAVIQRLRDSFEHKNDSFEIGDILKIRNVKGKFFVEIPIEYIDGFNKGRIIARESDSDIVEKTNEVTGSIIELGGNDLRKVDSFFYNVSPQNLSVLLDYFDDDIGLINKLPTKSFFEVENVIGLSNLLIQKLNINKKKVVDVLNSTDIYSNRVDAFVTLVEWVRNGSDLNYEFATDLIIKLSSSAFIDLSQTIELLEWLLVEDSVNRISSIDSISMLPSAAFNNLKFVEFLTYLHDKYEYSRDIILKKIAEKMPLDCYYNLDLVKKSFEWVAGKIEDTDSINHSLLDKFICISFTLTDDKKFFLTYIMKTFNFNIIQSVELLLMLINNNSYSSIYTINIIEILNSYTNHNNALIQSLILNVPKLNNGDILDRLKLREWLINCAKISSEKSDEIILKLFGSLSYAEAISLGGVALISKDTKYENNLPDLIMKTAGTVLDMDHELFGDLLDFVISDLCFNKDDALELLLLFPRSSMYNYFGFCEFLRFILSDVGNNKDIVFERVNKLSKNSLFNFNKTKQVIEWLVGDMGYNKNDAINLAANIPKKVWDIDFKFSNMNVLLKCINYHSEILEQFPIEFFTCDDTLLNEMLNSYDYNFSRSIFGIDNPKLISLLIYMNSVFSKLNVAKLPDITSDLEHNINFKILDILNEDDLYGDVVTDDLTYSKFDKDKVKNPYSEMIRKFRNSSCHFRVDVRDKNGNLLEYGKIRLYDGLDVNNPDFQLIIDMKDALELTKMIDDMLSFDKGITEEFVNEKINTTDYTAEELRKLRILIDSIKSDYSKNRYITNEETELLRKK